MSRLIDQVGLTAGVGLTDRAGLYKFGTFDPLSLNPYAYFDGESYKGTLENPTLDLDPSDPDTLDVITATRAGVATYTDADGLIQSAVQDTVRVDYTQGAELTPTVSQRVGYTDFSSGWINNGSSDVAGSGYSGEPSVVITGTNNNSSLYFNCPAVVGQEYIISMYIRRVSGTGTIRMRHVGAVEGVATDVTITNDWSRVEVPFTANSTSIPVGPQIQVSGESIEISQPQVEEGTTATDFVANTTGSPLWIASPTFGPRVPMVLIEPSAENLLPYSEDFSNAWWNKLNSLTIDSSSQILAPDGVTLVSKINVNSGRLNKDLSVPSTLPATGDYTFSAYYKGIAGETVLIKLGSGTQSFSVTLDGTWQRIEVPVNYASSSGIVNPIDNRSSGTATEVYLWGAQLETGSVATSYIPALSGSTVTRAKDLLIIDGSDFTDFYNQSEGTFYQEVSTKRITETTRYLSVNDNTNNSWMDFIRSAGTHRVVVEGQTEKSFSTAVVGQIHLLAMSHDSSASEFRASVDGVDSSPNPITGVTIPTNLTKLNIGSRYNGTVMCGHIKRVLFWPYSSENL